MERERMGREELRRFAREHHVHYEVEPETTGAGESREVVAVDVRLFATHGEAKLEAPGCPRCVELTRDLQAFAEEVARSGAEADRVDVEIGLPALYRSTEVPGADEVAITLRVRCEAPEHRRAGRGDPCLGGLRDRLAASGAPQR
jgi:hypothetical protein